MIFRETRLKGAYLIEMELVEDNRGFFARSFCQEEFKHHGIDLDIRQCNFSFNKKKGTLRGMHYQSSPYEEEKLITCIKGSIYDVIIDLRSGSPTYCQWFSAELSSKNQNMLYIPKGFAHGFQALEDDSVVFYQMSEYYHPENAKGVKWDDSEFEIKWPHDISAISQKDKDYSLYKKRIL